MISYSGIRNSTTTIVKLNRKRIGRIVKSEQGPGWFFKSDRGEAGATFPSIAAVQRSLEGEYGK